MVIEIERTRSLDVPFAPDQLYGAIYGGESKAHKFIITAMRDGTEATLSGTVTAKFLRADNVCVALTGTIEGGKACVVLGDECYATPGRFVLTIFVASGEENLCVYAAIGTTNRTDGTSTVDGGNIIPSVSDLIAQIDAAVATIPASYSDLMGSVAGTYSASNTYAVGDYVWYDGVLYRCTTAISTAESWTAAHWSRAVLGEDTSALKSAIKDITGNQQIQFSNPALKQYIVTNGTTVQWDNPSVSAGTNIKWAVIECSEGDVFTINGKGGNSDRLWAFADTNKNILDKAGSGATATNMMLTAPTNAKYLILNNEQDTDSYIGELLIHKHDALGKDAAYKNQLCYDFALEGNGSTLVQQDFKLVNGNIYKVAILNPDYSGSPKLFQINTYPNGTAHKVVVSNSATTESEYTFTADDDDARIIIRADVGQTVLVRLYDITEVTNHVSGIDRTGFIEGFSATKANTYVQLAWNRLYVKTNGGEYDFNESASYTLNGTNPILAIRSSQLTLLGGHTYIRSTDIILFVYNNGAIIGGLFYPYYGNKTFAETSALFCNNFTASMLSNGVRVTWSRLYIKLKDGEFNFTTTASYDVTNSSPLLIIRDGSVTRTGSFSGLRENDIVLLVCYNGVVNGGLLYPYYKQAIEAFTYDDDSHLNVYRNVQQLANLKWTPKADVDSGEGLHVAGTEVTGVPYSSVKEYLKYVGIDVSIHTFMTAVNDEHSLLYTEYPMGEGSESAYGRTYHGVNCKAYFGSVCSGLVTTAIGLIIQYNSWEYQAFPDVFDVLVNQDIKNLRVGDIMSYNGHCGVITNIRRYGDGSIATLQFDEHSAPIHLGTNHTPATLEARAIASSGVWCRYKGIENNTKYSPSPFVLADSEYLYKGGNFCFIDGVSGRTYYQCKPNNPNSDATFKASSWNTIGAYTQGTAYTSVPASYASVGDRLYQCIDGHTAGSTMDMTKWKEIKGVFEWAAYPYVYNDDIVTFAGDRAAFHTNDLIYIDYTKGSYTKMQLYKDGTLIQTINLPSSGYQIDVSSYCSGAGMYKARLTDDTNYSRYTYFEVIDATVSATYVDGEVTISFSSSNGTPIEWQIVEQSGATVCHMALSAEEITNGIVKVNPKAKMFAEKYMYPNRYTNYEKTIYARVMFAGEYGNVVNTMIELGTLTAEAGELVYPNEPKDIGSVSSDIKVMLANRMHGNRYSFSFTAETGGNVDVLPAVGKIKWASELPASLVNGTTYLVTVDNGIGGVVSVT